MVYVLITAGKYTGKVGESNGLSITVKTDEGELRHFPAEDLEHSTILSREAVVLRLYHGRRSADEDMEDWGSDGPVLGPLSGVIVTYGTYRLFAGGNWECNLDTEGDCAKWDNVLYGDFEICSVADAHEYGWKLTSIK